MSATARVPLVLTGPSGSTSCSSKRKWGFPKIRGTFLGVPIIRTMVFWGLYWGSTYFGKLPNGAPRQAPLGEKPKPGQWVWAHVRVFVPYNVLATAMEDAEKEVRYKAPGQPPKELPLLPKPLLICLACKLGLGLGV